MRAICTEEEAVWRVGLTASDRADRILLDPEGVAQLVAILERAESSPCRVVVLEGEPGSFCQGMDLAQAAERGSDASSDVHLFARCLRCLHASRKVVVAAVDGEVAGGGVGLAAAADLVVATDRSTFALPEVVLGLLPATVLPVLLSRMPPQKARRLCLLGSVGARQALELGLVDRLAPDRERMERALRQVIKHVLRCSPGAVAGLKGLQEQIAGISLEEALEVGADQTAKMLGEEATVAALRAFMEGEPLPWFARHRPDRCEP